MIRRRRRRPLAGQMMKGDVGASRICIRGGDSASDGVSDATGNTGPRNAGLDWGGAFR